jgi:hypothetical protein
LGCNNAAALLQGVATMKDVCNVVSDVFDSMFNATFPRNCHVKGLIEKELQFFLLHQELLKICQKRTSNVNTTRSNE